MLVPQIEALLKSINSFQEQRESAGEVGDLLDRTKGMLGRLLQHLRQENEDVIIDRVPDRDPSAAVSNEIDLPVTDRSESLELVNLQLRRKIEQHHQIELALKKSEAHYRAIIEDQTEMICRFQPDGTLTFVNQAYCRYFGKNRSELIGHHFMPGLPEEDKQAVQNLLASLTSVNPIGSIEHRVITPSGEIHWHRWTNRLIFDQRGQPCEYQAAGRDITDRKKVEAALAEERNLLRTLIDNLPDFIYFKDLQGRFIINNRAVAEAMGTDVENLIHKTDFEFFPEELAEEYYTDEQDIIRSGRPIINKEEPMVDVLGCWRWLSTTKLPLRNSNSEIIGVVGIGRDITDRRLMEASIREKSAELEAIFTAIPDAVAFGSVERKIRKVNPVFTQLFGYQPEEILGKKAAILYANSHMFQETGQSRFNVDAPETLEPFEAVYRRKNGTLFTGETVGTIVKDSAGTVLGYLAIIRDVTERKRTEEDNARLFEAVSQQREQLRALTGQLAQAQETERKILARELHDQVGQNLTALDLNLNIIHGRLTKLSQTDLDLIASRLDDSLSLVAQTAERIRNVMASLRPPVLDDYGLLAALRWYVEQFTARVGFSVTIEGQNSIPRLPEQVETTLFRIVQEALTNVAKHARADQVLLKLQVDDEFIRLVVVDDGIGFKLENWADPIKRKSWGLITMIERAEAIGGYCQIESELKCGTQVTVEVPR
ncbi:MAG TPA: PAS domain S-box protein [Anaerolineae bacterium]|nr:PAS domain S-box protein [Anaerolineae bacterium]